MSALTDFRARPEITESRARRDRSEAGARGASTGGLLKKVEERSDEAARRSESIGGRSISYFWASP